MLDAVWLLYGRNKSKLVHSSCCETTHQKPVLYIIQIQPSWILFATRTAQSLTTDFEAGLWSIQVVKRMLQRLWCLLQEPKDNMRNDREVLHKLFTNFKVLYTCLRNTPIWSTKTSQWFRSVWQLINNMHLATSAQLIEVLWIDGIPQSIVYLPHADKFIGFQFILHLHPTSKDRSS